MPGWIAAGRLRSRPPLGTLALIGLGLGGALAALALLYAVVEVGRFERVEARRAAFFYAAGQWLEPRTSVRAIDLAGTLARLDYTEVATEPAQPGEFWRGDGVWELFVRAGIPAGVAEPARVRLELDGERIARVLREGVPVAGVTLEPEVLTSVDERPGEEHRPLRLAEAPEFLVQSVLAAEDHRFFEHPGLDARGLVRALWANVRAGRVTQGGSTITQQLVKNRLLGAERTYWRKLREAVLALTIEWRYSKQAILEAYLNEIYLGQRGALAVRGVGSAARAYFGKDANQLTLGEAALLAGMIRAPNTYSPVLDPERARQRRDGVLARMQRLGWITDEEWETARREPIGVVAAPTAGQPAAYFADYVRQGLEEEMGPDILDGTRGARIFTTLDVTLQRFAEAAVQRGLARLERQWPHLRRADPAERLQAVLVALDPRTGAVRAMVGGRDYRASQFNRATRAHRQPGSAFKPFVYLAALGLRNGTPAFTPVTFVEDTPITLEIGDRSWSPRNSGDRYEGRVTVRRALEQSLNAATVRIAQAAGLDSVIETARAVGVTSPLRPVPALALGAFEVTPLELARAYLPFANGGLQLSAATGIRSLDEGDGGVQAWPAGRATQVVSPAEAYLMTSLLQGVIASGTGAGAKGVGGAGAVAGKTGTTNDGRDAWFVGYTPTLLALVWVGFDGAEPHGLSAAHAALPVWADFMTQALDAYPAPAFEAPPGVRVVDVDLTNGKTANFFCPLVARETFLAGTEPPPCEEHGGKVVDWWRRLKNWFGR